LGSPTSSRLHQARPKGDGSPRPRIFRNAFVTNKRIATLSLLNSEHTFDVFHTHGIRDAHQSFSPICRTNLIFEGQNYVFAPFDNTLIDPMFEEKKAMNPEAASKKEVSLKDELFLSLPILRLFFVM